MEGLLYILDIPVVFLTEALGSEVTGTRLFLTLLYVYPLTWLQTSLLQGKSAKLHQLAHFLSSAALLYYNFQWLSLHFLVNTLVIYILINIRLPRRWMIIFSLLINMIYLFQDYLVKLLDKELAYKVTWSTPHCVLTLKLIGITWDIYDSLGSQTGAGGDTAVKPLQPSLLELLGFSYFPPGLMTGPQISFSQYISLTAGQFDKNMSSRWGYAAARLTIGLVLMLSFPVLCSYIPTDLMFTESFKELNLFLKMLYVTIWGQVSLVRYVGVWLIAEGSCVLSGIAYNGTDEQSNTKWDGSANIKLVTYLTATRSQHYVESFNVNTNRWIFKYVYKRLKFLNNRKVSQTVSLLFLAIWHGFHTGYFMCFFLEFLIINGEKQIAELFSHSPLSSLYNIPGMEYLCQVISKIGCTFTLGYALVSFELITYSKYMQVYRSMFYMGHVIHLILLFLPIILPAQRPVPRAKPNDSKHQ